MSKMTTLKNALRKIEAAKEIVKDGDCEMTISFDLHKEEFLSHDKDRNLERFHPSLPYLYGAHDRTNENLLISFYC